jgi:hypothetical protein
MWNILIVAMPSGGLARAVIAALHAGDKTRLNQHP